MPKTTPTIPKLPPAKYVDGADCMLAYFTLGDRAGIPLVLCHGLAASGLQFVEDAHWFATNGFYVVVPDVRGHGRSHLKGSVEGSTFSVPTLANDMLTILDAEELGAVHWLGNSLGGIIALEMLGRTPDRFLSFMSFGTSYQLGIPNFAVAASAFIARLAGKDILANIFGPLTCREADGQAVISAMLKQTNIEAAVAIGHEVGRYNLIENALRFEGPILMLRCDQDTQVNGALKSTLKAMNARENFTLIDVADAGHCANLDQPEIVRQAALSFMQRS